MKLKELFAAGTVLSFEVFPPKANAPVEGIYRTLEGLRALSPSFISVTYGAGGSDGGRRTVELAAAVKQRYGVESVAHLTCNQLDRTEAFAVIRQLQDAGIENVLALRGDPQPGVLPKRDFLHASDLIAFLREHSEFHVSGACYPEVHPEAKSAVTDIQNLRRKVDAGAQHLISQLFFDNEAFYRFWERARIAGIHVPIEAGIMPVTNRKQVERMVSLCGATLPRKFRAMLETYEGNTLALRDAGIAYAIDQIVDLIAQGVDGIHLYTMNDAYVATRISSAVRTLVAASRITA